MSSLSVTRTYDDGEVLVRADLDAFLDDIETFINTTKVNDDNIQNSGITGSTKLLNASVNAAKLATNSVTTAKIEDSAVTTAKILDSNITIAKMADASVGTDELVASAVTTAKIADGNVTTDKLANDAVTNAKLADDAVQTENILASAVTTAKINDGAVTPAKHSTNYIASTLSGSGGAGDTYVQSSSYTASGSRPVMIVLYSGSVTTAHSSGSYIDISRYDTVALSHTSIGSHLTEWNISGNSLSAVARFEPVFDTNAANIFGSTLTLVDFPAAGTYKYEFKIHTASGTGTVSSVKMLVYEL